MKQAICKSCGKIFDAQIPDDAEAVTCFACDERMHKLWEKFKNAMRGEDVMLVSRALVMAQTDLITRFARDHDDAMRGVDSFVKVLRESVLKQIGETHAGKKETT
jgi:hypothetical protein